MPYRTQADLEKEESFLEKAKNTTSKWERYNTPKAEACALISIAESLENIAVTLEWIYSNMKDK